jgi:hypothetical protein
MLKGIKVCITVDDLRRYTNRFMVRYAFVEDENNGLVFHGYIVNNGIAQLIYSASHFRSGGGGGVMMLMAIKI